MLGPDSRAVRHRARPIGDKTIWLHYFAGPCDWWVAEYDPASGNAFGYACLSDPDNAEWGYTNLADLVHPQAILSLSTGRLRRRESGGLCRHLRMSMTYVLFSGPGTLVCVST